MTRIPSALALACALLLAPAAALGDTLHRSGPAEDRLDLVILADGYRASEKPQFEAEARRVWDALRSTEPFSHYAGLLNVHTGFRASPKSGVSPDSAYATRFRTTFGTLFYSDNRRLILSDAVRAGGGEADAVLVIVPGWRTGGTAVGQICFITTGAGPEVAVHELGHVIGGLGDEYSSWSGTPSLSLEQTAARYPNLTMAKTRGQLPWKDWVESSTTVPATLFTSKVSAYQGGGAYSSGIYRPQRSCRMRSDPSGFCAVCRQHLVLAFHEDSTPLKMQLSTSGGRRRLQVVSALPVGEWRVRWEGVQAQGLEAFVPAGSSVTVRLEDATPWVRGTLREGLRYSFSARGLVPAPTGPTRPGRVINVTSRLRVRAAAQPDAPVLGYLGPDAAVEVAGSATNGFYMIGFEGGGGYVSSDFVELDTINSAGIVGGLARGAQ